MPLAVYLEEIHRYRPLSREEEVALARRIHRGDESAMNTLVCANLRFVASVAKKYQHHGVPLSDLISEGNVGLMRAANRFDETRGIKFISYAVWWIRQAIVQALAEQSRIVRVPLSRIGLINRIRRRASMLGHELGRTPTSNELARGIDVSEREIGKMMAIAQEHVSLDAPLTPDGDTKLLDHLPDTKHRRPDDQLFEDALTESIACALSRLRPREATVLRLHFGLDTGEPMTLEAIGQRLGITRERTRQIKEKGLGRLRRAATARPVGLMD